MKKSKVKSVKSLGIRPVYDLTMKSEQHNFFLYDENKQKAVVSGNSHATAYTFVSARLLYLKAHYPLEFFVSTLALESDEDKLRSYKREAEKSGIKINRCDLNKSKENFSIVDDEIYIGFSNIKGIGEEVAKEIVRHQPYQSIEDFFVRFGVGKKIVEPLIYLNAFKDKPINVLLEFYEEYKKWTESKKASGKIHHNKRKTHEEGIKALLRDDLENDILNKFSDSKFLMDLYENFDNFDESVLSKEYSKDDFYVILKKYWKFVSKHEQKMELLKESFIYLENWKPKEEHINKTIPDQLELERKYYGFSWQHLLEKSSSYIGEHSFNKFKEDESIVDSGVECMIIEKIQEKTSKKGAKYYTVKVEDEDWNVETVTFWEDDYLKFKQELDYWNNEEKRGNLLQLRLVRPQNGFKSYTFKSPSKQEKYKYKNIPKEQDLRLILMEPPTKE